MSYLTLIDPSGTRTPATLVGSLNREDCRRFGEKADPGDTFHFQAYTLLKLYPDSQRVMLVRVNGSLLWFREDGKVWRDKKDRPVKIFKARSSAQDSAGEAVAGGQQ